VPARSPPPARPPTVIHRTRLVVVLSFLSFLACTTSPEASQVAPEAPAETAPETAPDATPGASPDASTGASTGASPGSPAILAADIQAHVDYLASDEMAGRGARTPEARVAADYIAAQLAGSGVEPLGDDETWFQTVDEELAPNVVGIVRGQEPGFVVISAHYDHLPPLESGDDRIFNGADDNASGVAAVLEVGAALGALETPPRRSIVLVAFTAEELGLRGAYHFVANPPLPLDELLGNLNMDMISRGEENLLFCEAGKGAEALLEAVRRANETVGLDIRYGEHPRWIRQSDQYAFVRAGHPALYFGVEDHVDYHKVSDHADKILPGLAASVAQLVYLTATSL